MKEINLYLDDKRVPNMSHNKDKGLGVAFSDESKWVIVRDYFEFVDLINNSFDKIKLISFDHDLACFKKIHGIREEYTGKTAADYLVNFCLDNNKKLPDWYVHTDNTSGRGNIIGALINYLKVIENFDTSDFRYYHNGIVNKKMI
jgi:hypothetical protein